MKFLLLGEAPNAATQHRADLWLLPDNSGRQHSANLLLEYSGLSLPQYLRIFKRDNLLHCVQKRRGRGFGFDAKAARETTSRVFDHGQDLPGVVMLGRRVAAAFTWIEPDGEGRHCLLAKSKVPYLRWLHVVDVGHPSKTTISAVVVPHPSGLNRWWNDASNLEAARNFFDRLLGMYSRS